MELSRIAHALLEGDFEVQLAPLRDHTDEELIRSAAGFGVDLSRESFAALASGHDSAESLAGALLPPFSEKLWQVLLVLWERWLPDRPSFEQVQVWLFDGYQYLENDDTKAALDPWRKFWQSLKPVVVKKGLQSTEEVDDVLGAIHSVCAWHFDYGDALFNEGVEESGLREEGILFSEELLSLFPKEGAETRDSWRRSIAENHFLLGRESITNRLFSQWLEEDPEWGQGYLGWAQCYSTLSPSSNPKRAEEILLRALKVLGVRDKDLLYAHLIEIYQDENRSSEVELLREEKERWESEQEEQSSALLEAFFDSIHAEAPAPLPLEARYKIGRNDPCPCGSGKKYKKCCLA